MIAFSSSVAAHGNGTTNNRLEVTSFQPAVPKIYISPYWNSKLKNVYYQTFGSPPNRNFKVYYDGWYDYPYESDWSIAKLANTSNVLTTGAGLTLSTTFTSGNGTNGYWQVTLPWSFNFYSTSYNQIFISHHGRVGIGDWKDGDGATITTNVTSSNNLVIETPVLPRIEQVYYAGSAPAGSASNNPRFGNRIYAGVHSGSSLTTSRVYKIRWEGSFYNTAGRELAWEMTFNESDLSSVTLHGALSPWQQQFNYASLNAVNVPLWNISSNGVAYQASKVYTVNIGVDYYNTSFSVSFGTSKDLISRNLGIKRQWEATFFENSSHFHCWSLDTLLKKSVNF
jgi:hypothetical protein